MKMPDVKPAFHDLSTIGGSGGREDCQSGWQSLVGSQFSGRAILDVGAGMGLSRQRLSGDGNTVTLQDPAPLDSVDLHDDVHEILARSYDVVTAFDVLEHVEEDWAFVARLLEVAREAVILTTPNFRVSRAQNPCHLREYEPPQLRWLAGALGHIAELRTGDATGNNPSAPISAEDFDRSAAPHLYVQIQPHEITR